MMPLLHATPGWSATRKYHLDKKSACVTKCLQKGISKTSQVKTPEPPELAAKPTCTKTFQEVQQEPCDGAEKRLPQ
jgi:hypothetical protein